MGIYKGDILISGNMNTSIYDPQRKETDIFAYIDDAIAEIPAPDMTQYYTKEQVDAAIAAAIEAAFSGIATVEGGSF